MNLIEALKSGRPFRRKMPHEAMRNLNEWKTRAVLETALIAESAPVVLASLDDILADDWEIQEPMVTITRTQFDKAVQDAIDEVQAPMNRVLMPMNRVLIATLARKLGLEDSSAWRTSEP